MATMKQWDDRTMGIEQTRILRAPTLPLVRTWVITTIDRGYRTFSRKSHPNGCRPISCLHIRTTKEVGIAHNHARQIPDYDLSSRGRTGQVAYTCRGVYAGELELPKHERAKVNNRPRRSPLDPTHFIACDIYGLVLPFYWNLSLPIAQ